MASADNVFNTYANQMAARFPEDNSVGDSTILNGVTAELAVLVDTLSSELDILERRALALRTGDVQHRITRWRGEYTHSLFDNDDDQKGLDSEWAKIQTEYGNLVDFVRAFGNSDNAEVYASEEKNEE